MRKKEFYKQWVKRAFSGSLRTAEFISGLGAIITAPIAYYWEPAVDYVNIIPLAVFGAVLIGTVVIGLVLAPYWITDEMDRKAEQLDCKVKELEKAKEPKLDIVFGADRPFASVDRDQSGLATRIFRVAVVNESDSPITGGSLYLEDIEGWDQEYKHVHLKQMSDGDAWDFRREHTKLFSLQRKDRIFFDVLWTKEAPPGEVRSLVLCYARTGSQDRRPYTITVSKGEFGLPLMAVCAEGEPAYRRFFVRITDAGDTEFEPEDQI